MAIFPSDEHPVPDNTERDASAVLPSVFHSQSKVIGPPGQETSVKTWPESLYLMVVLFEMRFLLGVLRTPVFVPFFMSL